MTLPVVQMGGNRPGFSALLEPSLNRYMVGKIRLELDRVNNEQLAKIIQECQRRKIQIEEFQCVNSPNLSDIPDSFQICTSFVIENTSVKSLPSLPQAKIVHVRNNQLTSLPELPNCNSLDCGKNRIRVIPFLPNCVELNCDNNLLIRLPNLPKLERLDCSNNDIMFLSNIPKAYEIVCKSNMIKTVGKINNVIVILEIEDNPKDGSYKLDCDKILRDNPTIEDLLCDTQPKPKAVMFTSVPEQFSEVESQGNYSQYIQAEKIAEEEFINFVNNQDVKNESILNEAAQVLYDALENEDYTIDEVKNLIEKGKNINLTRLEKIYKHIVKNINVNPEYLKQIKILLRIISDKIEKMELKISEQELQYPQIQQLLPYLRSNTGLPSDVSTYRGMRPAYKEIYQSQKKKEGVEKILANIRAYMSIWPRFQQEMGEFPMDRNNPSHMKKFAEWIYDNSPQQPPSKRQRTE